MNAETKHNLPALVSGAQVSAIVPRTFEDTYRIAKAVYMGGIAPAALTDKKPPEEAVSAITIAIMSGAELGLMPMVSLRSFTVINGRPALYGDGLITVVRQSGKAAYVRTGCDASGGTLTGWCEAKRRDTGEEKRVEFSQEDAIRAGLWETQAKVTKRNFKTGESYTKDNDSPWFRYPQRMLAWRAAGWCLRELFGDVLGGIRDEFEAREIEREADAPLPTAMVPPSPPSPYAENLVQRADKPESVEDAEAFDVSAFLTELDVKMALAGDAATIEEVWTDLDVEAALSGFDSDREVADKIKARHLARITPRPGLAERLATANGSDAEGFQSSASSPADVSGGVVMGSPPDAAASPDADESPSSEQAPAASPLPAAGADLADFARRIVSCIGDDWHVVRDMGIDLPRDLGITVGTDLEKANAISRVAIRACGNWGKSDGLPVEDALDLIAAHAGCAVKDLRP